MTNRFKNFNDTFEVIDNCRQYEFQKCLEFIEYQGKLKFGQTFKIHKTDLQVIYKLLIYSIRDQETALKLNIDLNKGILLSGKISCGKTSIMHLIKPFVSSKFDYKIKTCREVSFEYAKREHEALLPYIIKSNYQQRLPGFCFDDLGAEQQIKHFGNDCNVMAEILISRYEQFIENKSITHLTTNLTASEIENLYGNRLRSRMRAMFNLIIFDGNSVDKR